MSSNKIFAFPTLAKQLNMMIHIINNNQKEQREQTMTSLEIAELTGKNHFDLLRAIRKMEPAWEKTCGCKFALTSRTIIQPNGGTREVPCYQLTKTECLYIATKFNDEARAKLVLRWEQLEKEELKRKMEAARCLPEPQEILQLADNIIGSALNEMNADAEDTLTATQVAKTFNMTVADFNAVVCDMGIQYRRHGRWNISDDLKDRDLVRLRTYVSYSLKGEKKVRHYMTWTMQGLRFLNAKLGYPNF
jgi:phage regulator Rha-like protein